MCGETKQTGARFKQIMQPGPGPWFLLITVFILLAFGAGAGAVKASRPVLVVQDPATRKTTTIGPVSEGESFEVRFIHSVDLLPVHDVFICVKGDLVLTQTRCLSFGAGLGYAGEGKVRGAGKWNVIDDMNRKVGILPLRVGTIADHTIVHRGREYRLTEHFAPRSLVHIKVDR